MSNELYHYGVPGMKWGVRRKLPSTGGFWEGPRKPSKWTKVDGAGTTEPRVKTPKTHLTSAQKKQAKRVEREKHMSEDAKTAATLRKKKVSEMSNQELAQLNKRMEMETKYNQLNPSKVQKGMKIATTTAVMTTTLITLYNNADKIIKIGEKILKKKP